MNHFVFHDALPELPPAPIQREVLAHDDVVMLVRVTFEKGAVGASHHHPHRQASYVESGVWEVEIDGETHTLRTGDSFIVPPDVEHGAIAHEAGSLITVFSPARGGL